MGFQSPRQASNPPDFSIVFAFFRALFQALAVIKPLALVLYEKLLPGSQLVNRLQDLNYRVETLTDPELLVQCAEQSKPMIVLADLHSTNNNVTAALLRLKQTPATQHLPVIAFGGPTSDSTAPESSPVGMVVGEAALLNYLPQLLEQALHIE